MNHNMGGIMIHSTAKYWHQTHGRPHKKTIKNNHDLFWCATRDGFATPSFTITLITRDGFATPSLEQETAML